MSSKTIFIFMISILFFSSCATLTHEETQLKQNRAIHLKKLNKEVKKLNSHDKRLIYKSIKNEIAIHRKEGDEAYKYGYYYDAINAYELVNFYEDSNTIPLQKIKNMKRVAQENAISHYNNAKNYLNKDKKHALIELNTVLMNNPHYKDSQKLYNSLIKQRDIKIYINTIESSLETQLANLHGDYKELASIQKRLHQLEQYDYKNSSIKKARKVLKEQELRLSAKAINLYKQKKLRSAQKEFLKILTIYPHNKKVKEYLQIILFKLNKEKNFNLAYLKLQEKKYKEAMHYAENILKIEPKNKEAKAIIVQAKDEEQKALHLYIKRGKELYNNKDLDSAKEYFEKALNIDKNDNTSLIYYKKIQRQLRTIKSLRE